MELSKLVSLLLFYIALAEARFCMYFDQWHTAQPSDSSVTSGIDCVIIAFIKSTALNTAYPWDITPFVSVDSIRQKFGASTKVMVAVGGWADTAGFSTGVANDNAISTYASGVKAMLDQLGADGVDIDWEYPGGNGADYKQTPNSAKVGEIDGYHKLLTAIKAQIGPNKLLSIAVPGLERDMIAFTANTGPQIWPSVDMVNVMTYDLMNRRDNITKHHTDLAGSLAAINKYLSIGMPASKANLGFAYYAKWFQTAGDCGSQPLGCPTALLENPDGSDTGKSGALTFETANYQVVPTDLQNTPDGTCGVGTKNRCYSNCCGQYGYCGTGDQYCGAGCQYGYGIGCTGPDVAGSWATARTKGVLDSAAGGEYYFDAGNKVFWTWDTPDLIQKKYQQIVQAKGLGGVMAWSLGEDTYDYSHIKAMKATLGV